MRSSVLIAVSAAALAVAACQNNAENAETMTDEEAAAAADAGVDAAATGADGSMAASAAGGSGGAGGYASGSGGSAASGSSGSGSESMTGASGGAVNGGSTVPNARAGQATADGAPIDPANMTDTERRLNPQQNPEQ